MKFSTWLEQQESRAIIYVDLDETLLHNKGGNILLRPHAHEFIKNIRTLAPVYILTHGETEAQQQVADSVELGLKVFGRDAYDKITSSPNAVLVDNNTVQKIQDKLSAIQIDQDRLISVRPWFGEKQDRELLDVPSKIRSILSNKQRQEWVERTPQVVPKKQPFKTYNKARDLAKEREDKFYKGLKEAAQGHRVISDIKSKGSFQDKTEKRGKPAEKVFDVLRGAIIVNTRHQIDKVVDLLKKIFIVKKVEHKVKPEFFGYYGAVHVDVVVSDMICEVQIMTKKLWKYKMEADEVYHKYRSVKNPPKEEVEKARAIFRKANGD